MRISDWSSDVCSSDLPLAKDLCVSWQNGYAIFPDYQMLGTGHPGFFAAIGYPPNVVTQGLDMVTLFPLVRSLPIAPTGDWTPQPPLPTGETGGLETGHLNDGSVQYSGKYINGPRTKERREEQGG